MRVGKVQLARHHRQRKIATSRLLTCASPEYLAHAGIPRTPEELRKHRLIGYLRGDSARPADWQFRSGKGTRTLEVADGTVVQHRRSL